MKKKLIPLTLTVAVLAAVLPTKTHADLLVEQWQTPTDVYGGLAGVDAAIAAGAPDLPGSLWAIIDFTDDPSGFAGDIPGSSPWPVAAAAGVGGQTHHALNNFFGARITGILNITVADTYHFKTYADDGVRLRIGGTTVISDDTYHPEEVRLGAIALAVGSYPLELIFFEGLGEASLEFQVAQGNGSYGHVGGIGGPVVTPPSVPDAGSTLAMLGLAIVGSTFFARRRPVSV